MRPIPLNFQTMYADLLQTLSLPEVQHGSISTRKIKGNDYLYLTTKDGSKRRQVSLGRADDPQVRARADAISDAASRARILRTTVSALKKARIPSPTLPLGRVLEVIANEGLFKQGVMLIGTAAYQTYPCIVGAYLPSSALMTNDADLLVSSFIAKDQPQDLEKILQRADPTFQALMSRDDKLPKVFRASNNFQVDVLTKFGRNRTSPRLIDGLVCSAEALSFMEYLGEESIEAVALYGTGVLVSVPPPVRYAIHKLLVAQERKLNSPKRAKDLKQAKDLIDVFIETDPAGFEDALEDARGRGSKWKRNIDASLQVTGQNVRQTRLFSLAEPNQPKSKRAR
ncbi:GSU2403 family nucleotidyltransferase fold protein [Hyphomicrobium sp.]|uniref:GSU2403 family nucleotidyltransferase fold protein n=1 Tax=Hyphomicrobium sp. TaxID=82 RepID=UPI0025C64636|nr:GSU2403 family nucleotidyltransferase fold protein [Hyphomicrobium sp.]